MIDIQTAQEGAYGMEMPPIGVNVIVQCYHLRCLAYRTQEGKWLATFTGQEVKDVIRYFPLAESAPAPTALPLHAARR